MCRSSLENITYEFLLLQCPVCLAVLTWMFCEMAGKWLYICCFISYCFRSILYFQFSFFHRHFLNVQVLQLYCHSDMATTGNNTLNASRLKSVHALCKIFIFTNINEYIFIKLIIRMDKNILMDSCFTIKRPFHKSYID